MHIHAHLVQLSKQTHKPILHIVLSIRFTCNMLCLLCSTPRRFFGQQFSPRICGLNLWALGHFMSRFLCWGGNRQIIRSISGHCLRFNCCRACRWFTFGVSLVAILFTFPFAFGDSFAFGFSLSLSFLTSTSASPSPSPALRLSLWLRLFRVKKTSVVLIRILPLHLLFSLHFTNCLLGLRQRNCQLPKRETSWLFE